MESSGMSAVSGEEVEEFPVKESEQKPLKTINTQDNTNIMKTIRIICTCFSILFTSTDILVLSHNLWFYQQFYGPESHFPNSKHRLWRIKTISSPMLLWKDTEEICSPSVCPGHMSGCWSVAPCTKRSPVLFWSGRMPRVQVQYLVGCLQEITY